MAAYERYHPRRENVESEKCENRKWRSGNGIEVKSESSSQRKRKAAAKWQPGINGMAVKSGSKAGMKSESQKRR